MDAVWCSGVGHGRWAIQCNAVGASTGGEHRWNLLHWQRGSVRHLFPYTEADYSDLRRPQPSRLCHHVWCHHLPPLPWTGLSSPILCPGALRDVPVVIVWLVRSWKCPIQVWTLFFHTIVGLIVCDSWLWNASHILRCLLPAESSASQTHNSLLPDYASHLFDSNFIMWMLFKDVY